jgi:hypothetical protein
MASAEYVLVADVVARAIEDLRSRPVHPFFPAYLHLRQRSGLEGSTDGIKPRWKELGPYLEVAGAPAAKPYYRPFWEGEASSGQEWLNSNLAGSFAGSSLRPGNPPMSVVEYDRGAREFSLRSKHWELARRFLLNDERLPIGSLLAFMLRDFSFLSDEGEPNATATVQLFLNEFGYGEVDTDEVHFLYDLTILDAGIGGWFEPAVGLSPIEERS